MQSGQSRQLPILGAETAWSILDLSPRLRRLYGICQQQRDSEVSASAFAEATVSAIFDSINDRRRSSRQPDLQFDLVSQQPPDRKSKRRIDFQVVGWKATQVPWQGGYRTSYDPFPFAHVEVKRHGAQPSEIEILEGQIMTAFEESSQAQDIVYGIAFHGTAIRIWSLADNVLHAMTGYDSHDVDDKRNWIDAAERGPAAFALLGAFLAMVKRPPFPLLGKSHM
jgi:hypothetical protein